MDDVMMMMTRWSLFSVVKDRVVLIFVEEERKEEGTREEVRRKTFQVNTTPMIFLLTHTQTTII